MNSFADLFPVSELEKVEILTKYGKNKDSIKDDVCILKEWLRKQKHIPEIKDDLFLEIMFLRNKCRIEKTKEKIDSYYASKNIYDIFDVLDPGTEKMIQAAKYHHICFLPTLTSKNERIVYLMTTAPSEEYYDQTMQMSHLTIRFESQLQCDYADSIVLVINGKGITGRYVFKFDVPMIAKSIRTFYNVFSGRVTGAHFVNGSTIQGFVMKFVKPLISAKLRERIFVHDKVEDIFEHIPREYLPTEIGGTACSAIERSTTMSSVMRTEREYILKRNKLGTNEKLRVGKPFIQVDLYGADGTFKKINID